MHFDEQIMSMIPYIWKLFGVYINTYCFNTSIGWHKMGMIPHLRIEIVTSCGTSVALMLCLRYTLTTKHDLLCNSWMVDTDGWLGDSSEKWWWAWIYKYVLLKHESLLWIIWILHHQIIQMLKTAHSWRLEVPLQTNSPTKRRQVNHRRVRSDADMELATSQVRDASLGNMNFERPYRNYPKVISMS